MQQSRYKIIIEYIGKGIKGWQRQNNALSVQQIIEEAIYCLSKVSVTVHAAGRTDSGVHALGQVAHFDLPSYYDPYRLMQSINYFVRPHLIGIIDCTIVSDDFHARFSAIARHYVYKIINRNGPVIINADRAWWIKEKLDVEAMREGAKYLIGKHDFTSYRAKRCQAESPIKTLSALEIDRKGDEINFYVSAPSFLHNMVRNIVGSLILVGLYKWQPENIKIALEAKKREAAGIKAPAHGLYLLRVDY